MCLYRLWAPLLTPLGPSLCSNYLSSDRFPSGLTSFTQEHLTAPHSQKSLHTIASCPRASLMFQWRTPMGTHSELVCIQSRSSGEAHTWSERERNHGQMPPLSVGQQSWEASYKASCRGPVTHGGHLLHKASSYCVSLLLYFISLTPTPWDHFANKLPICKSLAQLSFGGIQVKTTCKVINTVPGPWWALPKD